MPTPLSDPLFSHAVDLVHQLRAGAASMTLEELRILETALKSEIATRRAQIAAQLRGRGYSWTDVGKSLGVSGQRAHAAYAAAEKPANVNLD